MKGKIALLAGAAAGYVLGTRAGRERYEQLKTQAQGIWQNPKVQEKKAQAQDLAREKAPEMQQKVADATAAAKSKVGKGSQETGTPTSTGTTVGDPVAVDPLAADTELSSPSSSYPTSSTTGLS